MTREQAKKRRSLRATRMYGHDYCFCKRCAPTMLPRYRRLKATGNTRRADIIPLDG